jgi:predicted permease
MMDSLQRAVLRLRSFFNKRSLDHELEAELAAHIDLATEENIQMGMAPEEARRRALIALGGIEQTKGLHRETRGLPGLDILLQDLRYALRGLRRDRVFSLVAVLILALGIGLNIVVFSVVNTILLRPLPFPDAERLATIVGTSEKAGLADITYTADTFQEFQQQNHSFKEVTAYYAYSTEDNFVLSGRGEPKPVSGISVAGNFFQTLGVEPIFGRLFTAEECLRNGSPAVILAYPFWKRQFNADASIVGKTITLDDKAVTVVGVLPDSFDFGSVFRPGAKVDVYVPTIMDDIRGNGNAIAVIGRLNAGVSLSQAQAEADLLFPQLRYMVLHPDWGTVDKQKIKSLKDHVSGKLRRSLIVLWTAVGFVFLIVCVNLSNLLLARGATRTKEFAMRTALGASRGRLIRQLLTESLCLSGAGAVVGLGMAYATTAYVAHQGSIALPLLNRIKVDSSALAWTLLIAVMAAILFGLAPGLKTAGGNLQEALKDCGAGMSEGRKQDRLRAILVISEVALACMLLTGAGLLLRSFLRVMDVDLGFQPSRAAAIKIDYDDNHGQNDVKRSAILREIMDRITAIPGIEGAGMTDNLPLERNRRWGLTAKGEVRSKDQDFGAFVYIVTPGYLNAMGMRLRTGRDFSWQDTGKDPTVVIINEAAARRHWPGQDPIGRTAIILGTEEARVIGVIDDVHVRGVEESPEIAMYLPVTQANPVGKELVVRSKLPPEVLASSVMHTLRSINPAQPATEFRTIQQIVDHATSPRRFFALLVSVFAALGLLLASLGIYGVISYSVTRQTQEIGIKMALGADSGRVQRDVIKKTMRLAFWGISGGIIGSFGVARMIMSLLFGTTPTDPITFGTTIFLLGAVALLAGYIPARRASRISPLIALRSN